MQDRAYSLLTVKQIDDGQRIISGTATTPSLDRVGDMIDPLGCQFSNPAPLLWMHRHDQPVGTVNFATPTSAGVRFTAKIPKVTEPGTFKDRVDEAWESVRAGVVRAVSIGFRPLDGAVKRLAGGGTLFEKIEIIELSLVSVPANADATISNIKLFDTGRAAEPQAKREGWCPEYPAELPTHLRSLIIDGAVANRINRIEAENPDALNASVNNRLFMERQFKQEIENRWLAARIEELEKRLGR